MAGLNWAMALYVRREGMNYSPSFFRDRGLDGWAFWFFGWVKLALEKTAKVEGARGWPRHAELPCGEKENVEGCGEEELCRA